LRPFLVTDLQAGKLPRWGLLLLCALYIAPGLLGRDPWKVDDAVGFGVAFTLSQQPLSQWLAPSVFGELATPPGWLPYWIWASLIRAADPWFTAGPVVRVAAGLQLGLAFGLFWHALYALAKRPGLQPLDPLGASAHRIDFARAVADSGLLVLLATLGLLARLHETTAVATQLLWVCLTLWGMAVSLEYASRGALFAALGIIGALLTMGLNLAAALGLACVLTLKLSQPFGLNARRFMLVFALTLVASLAVSGVLVKTAAPASLSYLELWWQAQLSPWQSLRWAPLRYALTNLPWFFWPAWPMAAWALWRWRSRLDEPVIALAVLIIASLSVPALFSGNGSEGAWLPLAPAIAILAAISLPTLSRRIISLVDWLAVLSFSLFGVVVWAYWLALMSGTPKTMALKARLLAPGYTPSVSALGLGIALLASVGWVLLVRWRVSRQPPMIWRAVVLACGGLVLCWLLLMTLWLPMFNERNTYRDVGQQLARAVKEGCLHTSSLGLAERASLGYFGRLDLEPDRPVVDVAKRQCPWLLVQDFGPIARTLRPDEPGWIWVEEFRRRSNADERFRLYRRQQ
jgi:hypothetical protein